MKKTFLLGASPWAYLFLALLFVANASSAFFDSELNRLEYWMMILNMLAGIYMLLFVLFVSTDFVGTAPKVVVYNEGILLKAKAFSGGIDVKWSEVQSITFHSYQLDFKLDTKPVFFNYKSSAKISKQIKEAIRDMADLKQIPITGG